MRSLTLLQGSSLKEYGFRFPRVQSPRRRACGVGLEVSGSGVYLKGQGLSK